MQRLPASSRCGARPTSQVRHHTALTCMQRQRSQPRDRQVHAPWRRRAAWRHGREPMARIVATSSTVAELGGVRARPGGGPSDTVLHLQQDQAVQQQEQAGQPQKYNWLRNWWPVLPENMLHRDKPNAITLLGRDLVVWWNALESQWVVMQDSCPHRLSPLSQGRLSSPGVLTCSYHGWSFGPGGACASIPQLDTAAAVSSSGGDEQTAKAREAKRAAAAALVASKRTCVRAYPTRMADDLLLVWLDDSPEGLGLSKVQVPPLPEYTGAGLWSSTQFYNDASFWLEQTMDPSHANFLHAGAFGFRMENAIPMEAQPIAAADMSVEGGFTLVHGGYDKGNAGMKATRDFHPPCFYRVSYDYPSGFRAVFLICTVPVMPGQCRTFAKFLAGPDVSKCERLKTGPEASRQRREGTGGNDHNTGSNGASSGNGSNGSTSSNGGGEGDGSSSSSSSSSSKSSNSGGGSSTSGSSGTAGSQKEGNSQRLPSAKALLQMLSPNKLREAVVKALPHWARLGHAFGDQDAVLLYFTEQAMLKQGKTTRDYTMSPGSDEGVAAIDRWMRQAGYYDMWQSLFPGSAPERVPVSLERVLDRGFRHVDHCAVCQKGLRMFEKAIAVLRALLFIAGAAASGQWAVAALPGAPATTIIGAAVTTALAAVFALVLRKVEEFKEDQFVSGLRAWKRVGGLSLVKPE